MKLIRMNEDAPGYKIIPPRTRNWSVSTRYDDRHGSQMSSELVFVYKGISPIKVTFTIYAWKRMDDNDKGYSDMYRNPWFDCTVSVGAAGGYTSSQRAVADDEDGSLTTSIIAKILSALERNLDDVIEFASDPNYTLVGNSKQIQSAVDAVVDNAERIINRLTVDRYSIL